MSSSNKCIEVSESILKLRTLREKLCKNDDEWKKAFEVRDYVISGLQELQDMLDDETTAKKDCSLKLREILHYFKENNNV